jgi:DNA 3'-phosphatase
MFSAETTYSEYWKDLGSILVYKHPQFQFHSSVIITELDDCIIKYMPKAKLYDTINKHEIKTFDDTFVKRLIKESADKSIVILSNQLNKSKLIVDMVKKKFETLLKNLDIPIIGIFATLDNCFSKPHTGMWKLLNAYYKKFGNTVIRNTVVISNDGGMIIDKEKKNGDIISRAYTDTDRVFAHNISAQYLSIEEYLGFADNGRICKQEPKEVKFQWNSYIIPPEVRALYIKELQKLPEKNIFKELNNFGIVDAYIIIIMGAPRCGKTTYAKTIIKKWRNSRFGESNAVERLGLDKYTNRALFSKFKKLIADRISVVIDGVFTINKQMTPFLDFIKNMNVAVQYVEIYIGIEMAKVLNHVAVEDSNSDTVMLRKQSDYDIYKSMYKRPNINNSNGSGSNNNSNGNKINYMLYYPKIELKPSIVSMRY